VSASIDENGVRMEKLGLKYDSRTLFAEDLKLKGLGPKKPRASSELNLRLRG
jgi:hypothetical protein